MAKRHRTPGITKVCGCKAWAKCAHSYYLTFRYKKGKHWRLSLDKLNGGEHIEKLADAKALADDIRGQIRRGEFQAEIVQVATTTPDAVTFTAFGQLWIEREREGQIGDWKSDRSRLHRLSALPLEDGPFGERSIGRLTLDDWEVAFRALKASGITGQTINKYLQTVAHLQRWGVKKGYLVRPWFDSDNRPATRAKVARRSRRLAADVLAANGAIVEPGEERRLLAVANPWLQRLIIAAIETGMRRGELLKLQWSHVDLTRGRLTLPAEITKTNDGRIVIVSARLRAVLEMVRTSALTGKPHLPAAYVFGNAAGEAIGNPKKAWEVCILKAHGHTPQWAKSGSNRLTTESRATLAAIDLHWHDLRHEAGSRWLEAGWPLHHVQKMLGHADLKQTSTYLNATEAGMTESMRKMDEARGLLQSVAQLPAIDPRPLRNEDSASDAKVLIN